MKHVSIRVCLVALIVAVIAPVVAAASDAFEPPMRFRGRVASVGGPAGGSSAYLVLQADRLTSDEEVARLAGILVEDGDKALLKALSDVEPAGWIRIGDGTRYHLRVVRLRQVEGGHLLRAVTDRPIYVQEITRTTRSRKYTFGFVEIFLEQDGDGSGAVVPAAKITFNEGTVEVESFGTQPFHVLNVKPEPVQNK